MEANTNERPPQMMSGGSKSIFAIPVHVSGERRQNALLGQLEHHRNRRLSRNERQESKKRDERLRVRKLTDEDAVLVHHNPASWRQSYESSLEQKSHKDHRHLDASSGLITDVGLSNCHLVLYSGEITLGSPPHLQQFRVDFDTAGSDVWVPSKLCDETCLEKHPGWNLYDPSKSSTYSPATTDLTRNEFALEYQDGEAIKGEHAKDTLRLGNDDIRIPHQVFAHVTHIQNFATCEEEEGILGLANSMTTSHGFPSVLGNILHQSHKSESGNGVKLLRNNVFGIYLRSDVDDYEGVDIHNNEEPKRSSELILGGVNQDHYLGCLKWHDLMGTVAGEYANYWSVQLDDVKVGGTTLNRDDSWSNKIVAVLDSGSSYIVGPQEPIARLVELNKAKCFRMEGGATNNETKQSGSQPKEVDCSAPGGFDGAVLNNCEDPFFSVEFVIDGEVYVLEKEDLMVHLETVFGTVCILRVVASQGMNGWILGDAFLNKYYTAFDFENQKLGLALAAESAEDRCDKDIDLDVTHFWKSRYGDEEDDEDFIEDFFSNDQTQGENGKEDMPGGNPQIGTIQEDGNNGANINDFQDEFEENEDNENDESFQLPPLPPEKGFESNIPDTVKEGATKEQVDSWVDEVVEAAPEVESITNEEVDSDATSEEENAEEGGPWVEQVIEAGPEMEEIIKEDMTSESSKNSEGDGMESNKDSNKDGDDFSVAQFPKEEFQMNDLPSPSPSISPPVHVPSHYEVPETVPVPSLNGFNSTASMGTKSGSSVGSFYGIFGVSVVVALVVVVVVYVFRRRRNPSKKQQQARFEKAYNNAERKIVNDHRNLNYRDHSSSSFHDALDDIEFTHEEFHDEEGGHVPNSGEGGNDIVEFVLDENILQRMN